MKRIPKYSLHKATGQALVRLDGKVHYLGKHNSEEPRKKYDQPVAKWLTGEKLNTPDCLTVSRLCGKYVEEHARPYYRKNGRPTSEVAAIQGALRPLIAMFGKLQVHDFGPTKLKRVRQDMVDRGVVRTSYARAIKNACVRHL